MAKNNKEISLTDFIDFVNKIGAAKQTKVRTVKYRAEYEVFSDFYKPLRDEIVNNHKNNGCREDLDGVLEKVTDRKKMNSYKLLIDGYKKFWGRRNLIWVDPPRSTWTESGITIRINPEIALEQKSKDGKSTFYVIKFYFKEDAITKYQVDQILTLMEYKLRDKVKEPEIVFALLDIRKHRLYEKKNKELKELPLLSGEFSSFATIWNMI